MTGTATLNAILRKRGLLREQQELRSGRIVIEGEPVLLTDPGPALRAFLAFGGEGWLCSAESPAILHTATGGAWPPPQTAWPLQGELAAGDRSLHLRRTPQGWSFVTLREVSGSVPNGANGYLMATELHSHLSRPLRLRYTVGWEPVEVGGSHHELRPVVARFTGFGEAAS